MARMTAESPLPPVYRLAILATEALLWAAWVVLPNAVGTLVGLLLCYAAMTCTLGIILAKRRQEPWQARVGGAVLFVGLRWQKLFLWVLLGVVFYALYAVVTVLSEFAHLFYPQILFLLVALIISLVTTWLLVMPWRSFRRFGSSAEGTWAEELREFGWRFGVAWPEDVLLAHDGTNPKAPGPAAYRMGRRTAEFLFDQNFMNSLTSRERLAVFAHELAHHRLNHSCLSRMAARTVDLMCMAVLTVWLLLLMDDVRTAIDCYPPAFFLSWLMCLLLQPLYMAYLRAQERQANVLAVRMTGDVAAFQSAMVKLAEHLGAERHVATSPVGATHQRSPRWMHWMFDTHPTLEETLSQVTSDKRRATSDK